MTAITNRQSGHANVKGACLYYEVAGTGAPLILLHAGIADRRMWDEQLRTFAQEYQVIRYDLRGYGNSTRGEENGHERRISHTQDLYDLLQVLNLDQVLLLGCSQGGATVIDFALTYPTLVRALVLVAAVPSGYNFAGAIPPKLPPFVGAYQQGDLAQAAELATQLWLDGPQRQPEQMNPLLREQVRAMMWDVLAKGVLDLTGAEGGEPAIQRLGQIKAPTLVMVGDQDAPTILQAGDLLATAIANSEKVVFPGAAHLPNLEKPMLFNELVLDFFQRLQRERR